MNNVVALLRTVFLKKLKTQNRFLGSLDTKQNFKFSGFLGFFLWHRKQISFFQVYIEPIILWHLITSICNRVHWATEVLTCLIEDPQSLVSNHGSGSMKILQKFSARIFSRQSEQGRYFPPKSEKTLAEV